MLKPHRARRVSALLVLVVGAVRALAAQSLAEKCKTEIRSAKTPSMAGRTCTIGAFAGPIRVNPNCWADGAAPRSATVTPSWENGKDR